jgi:tape measure domain-containing protein
MDLTRTLQVKIDPGGAVAGGNAAANAFRSVGTAAGAMDKNVKGANDTLAKMAGGAGGGAAAGGTMGAITRGASSMKAAFASLSAAMTALGLGMFAKSLIETQTQMDRMGNSLRYATGSAEAGAEAMDWIRNVSKTLGMDLATSGQAFAKLAAATRGTSIDMTETQRIFLAVSKASTVLGLSSDETSGALMALQQMVSKGTVQAEELRGQLGERLPGAFNMAAKAMGVTTEELGKMLENGQVTAARMLPALAREMEKAFGPEAARAAGSLNSEMNRLSTSWTEFKEALMKSGVLELITSIVDKLKEAIETAGRFVKAYAATGASWKTGNGFLDTINQFNPFVMAARAGEAIGGPMQILPKAGGPALSRDAQIAALAPKSKNLEGGTMAPFKVGSTRQDDFRFGVGLGVYELNEKTGQWTNKFSNAMKNAVAAGQQAVQALDQSFGSFFDSLIDGTTNVGQAFKNLASSIVTDMAKIFARQAIINPLIGAIGGAIGIKPAPVPVGKSHTGSLVGAFGGTSTLVNPAIFAGAPRFHGGLAPDEFPAILQRGEAVIPKNQVRGMSGGGVNLAVTVNMNGGGGGQEDGQAIGQEVARQVQQMVRSMIVRERMPRGMLA